MGDAADGEASYLSAGVGPGAIASLFRAAAALLRIGISNLKKSAAVFVSALAFVIVTTMPFQFRLVPGPGEPGADHAAETASGKRIRVLRA